MITLHGYDGDTGNWYRLADVENINEAAAQVDKSDLDVIEARDSETGEFIDSWL